MPLELHTALRTGTVHNVESALIAQLVLAALSCGAAVVALLAARRAASFDVTGDLDSLMVAVSRLQKATRSERMARVRAGGSQGEPAEQDYTAPGLSKEHLRALARAIPSLRSKQ